MESEVPNIISFNFHVRSILSENCFYCHGPDPNHREADLRLDMPDGYESVVDLDSPLESELLSRIFAEDLDLQMPPPESGRVLSDRDKKILSRWIQQGAQYEQHWAFEKPVRPEIPEVSQTQWPRNPIDHFILSSLEQHAIAPSPRAEPATIVRRLYLDLIGLPPTPKQSQAFLNQYDLAPDTAIEDTVDELLQSPHYGERMALPWLDAARYSDSNGFQQDGDRMQWPWRDWVVNALNANMPFDQFTIEQLAGDLLPDPTQEQLIATGFNRNHMLNGEGGAIAEESRVNYVFDRVDTTATTWLGLTMACAQCHDHKYDPTTQEDYYQFYAYFNSVDERGNVDRRNGRSQIAKPYLDMPTQEQTDELASLDAQISPLLEELDKADEEITAAMREWEKDARKKSPENMDRGTFNELVKTPAERGAAGDRRLKNWYLQYAAKEEWREIKKQEVQLNRKKGTVRSKILSVMVMRELEKPRATHVLTRGNYEAPAQQVSSDVPHFLPSLPNNENSTRLDLARWLVHSNNPLTARVQVNRYWQTFFGTGIVKTAEDFGVQAELPSHPELLDWLAVEFRESGWNVKRLQRLIVTSETYLQASKFRADLKDSDPANRLLARGPRYRMPSSLIRDAALSSAGLLNPQTGGPPVYPYQPKGLWKEFSLERFSYKPSEGDSLYRRSLYTFWRRTVPPPNMFDSSGRQTCTVKLSRTNTPLQALTLLNDPTFVEAATYLASSIFDSFPHRDAASQLRDAFARCVSRLPSESELGSLKMAFADSEDFYRENITEARKFVSAGESIAIPESEEQLVQLAALASAIQVIMNTDEFMTRE
ncbi:MAG: PSD1 and planctomycete cytochrome C domain-containing protein [Aureliella sp.]